MLYMLLVESFRSCVLSWFFLWHMMWLSIMQLRHYLFIGTLNPMLNRLADNDPNLGNSMLTDCDLKLSPYSLIYFCILSSHHHHPI